MTTTKAQRQIDISLGITGKRMSLGAKLDALITLTNELLADHATVKTSADVIETLIEELHDDHATLKTAFDAIETLIEELHDDHATFKTVVDALKTLVNVLANDGLLGIGTLAVSATAEDFKTTTTAYYRLDGIQYSKAATDNLSFSAADTINTGTAAGDYWGIWLVQINAADTVSTKSPSSDQVYADQAAAIAALPAVDADNVALGYITVQANTDSAWTANTDDLTAASDCQAVNFVDGTPVDNSAVSDSSPATLSAAKPASGPATLTATKPASGPATLSASAVDALPSD